MAIEEEFSIEIPDKDADTIHSSTFVSVLVTRLPMFPPPCSRTTILIFRPRVQSTRPWNTSSTNPTPTNPVILLFRIYHPRMYYNSLSLSRKK